ncbi:unnamed protein product [Cylindrotheca closterium]|uniref:Uncharacterized protein n=1 Tax=Cylindrotheca closterium TaxID=2856 RepID=A0AAD2G258_9STRA|nr:unnamed protein product [Cylindrotheca closterium]
MKIIINATRLRTISDGSSSIPTGLPMVKNRPLHADRPRQPAVTLAASVVIAKRNRDSKIAKKQRKSTTTSTAGAIQHHSRTSSNKKPFCLDFNGNWRSEADMPARRIIIQKIVRSIRTRRPYAPQLLKRQLPMIVKRIEEALYKNAPSMEIYSDHSTLELRLEILARQVQEQAAATRNQH